MSNLNEIVNVTITSSAAPVAQESFSIPLIVGSTNAGWTDVCHVYTDPADMLTDGFLSSSPEYITAAALYNGSISPAQFCVGARAAGGDLPQKDQFVVPTVTVGAVYSFKLGTTTCTYTAVTSDLDQQILNALMTQAVATGLVTGLITNGSGSSKILTLTGATSGLPVSYSAITVNLTHTVTQQPSGIGQDLAAIQAENDTWYMLLTPQAVDADILQAAAWIQSQTKAYLPVTATAACYNPTSTTDVLAKLAAATYTRTTPLFSINGFTTGIDGTLAGGQLPLTPGSNNWNLANLPGQLPDALNGTQVAAIQAKKGNLYRTMGGANVYTNGITSGGQFIDIIIGTDWLENDIQSNIFTILRDVAAAGKKISYTDPGAAQIAQGVRAGIVTAGKNNFVDLTSGYTVTATKVADTPSGQRANRMCPDISFSCQAEGAINTVTVNGNIAI
jgi:hypothetical protein